MKKNQRPTFAQNLIKARKANNWTQHKAADLIGISRGKLGSYEEGRALPPASFLPTIVHVYGITDIMGFLDNPSFSYHAQSKPFTAHYDSALEKRYASALEKERQIVDLALGIGLKEVTC